MLKQTIQKLLLIPFFLSSFHISFADINDAWNAYDQENYQKAYQEFNSLAKNNESEIAFILGTLYLTGKGTPTNIEKAIELFEKSAQLQNAKALFNLGVIYNSGFYTSQSDTNRAITYFKKAAKLGFPHAYTALSVIYLDGNGVKEDPEKGMEYLLKASKLEDPYSQALLAMIYYQGIEGVVDQDFNKMLEYAHNAAQNNVRLGYAILSLAYRVGDGVEENLQKADEYLQLINHNETSITEIDPSKQIINIYGDGIPAEELKTNTRLEKSASRDNPSALYQLGYRYQYGIGVHTNLSKAHNFYESAAKLGSTKSMLQLYSLQNDISNLEWIEKAAKLNDSDAYKKLADIYYFGGGEDINKNQAYDYYLKAAELGNQDSQRYLAMAYQQGFEVNKNLEEAFKWYFKLAELNDSEAQYQVADAYEYGKGVQQNNKKALEWYLINEKHPQPQALTLYQLGNWYRQGNHVGKDIVKALDYYQRMISSSNFSLKRGAALFEIARIYRDGDGITKDLNKAKELLERSAQLNEEQAIKALDEWDFSESE